MTEPLDEPRPSDEVPEPSPPVESHPDDQHEALARKNTALGWSLFGLSLLLFAGVWVVAYIYLALD